MGAVGNQLDRGTTCEEKVYDAAPMNLDLYFGEITGKRVLDVGCGTGKLGAALVARGNECYGITISGTEAEQAKARLSGVVLGDVEALRQLPFPERFFDVVIFSDVLEHLRQPVRALALVKPYLKPEGRIIASIPNVANIAVRWNLLRGRFDYEPSGILDDTHVRFYTLRTAHELIESAGYIVQRTQFTHWNWELPQPIRLLSRPYEWEIKDRLAGWWPGLFATQFVIYATYQNGPGDGASR